MKKEKEDVDCGFKIGDKIRHKKHGFEGTIEKFDWCGIERAVLIPNGKANKGWYIYTLQDIELVNPVVKEDMKPEPIVPKKRGRKKKERETGESN